MEVSPSTLQSKDLDYNPESNSEQYLKDDQEELELTPPTLSEIHKMVIVETNDSSDANLINPVDYRKKMLRNISRDLEDCSYFPTEKTSEVYS